MKMVGHQLRPQNINLGRKLGYTPDKALNQPPQIAQLDKRPAPFRVIAPPKRAALAIGTRDRDLLGPLPPVLPISATTPHAMNDIAHPRARLFIDMPPRRWNL